MKTTRKTSRERATPEMILATCLRIATARGWGAVTIRAVADELGYASPLIYEHFANKDEALAELARRGFMELEASVTAAVDNVDPRHAPVAAALAYVRFAGNQPALYQVMHGMNGVAMVGEAIQQGAESMCRLGASVLVNWANADALYLPDPVRKTEILWCTLHGAATLAVVGRLDADLESLVTDSVQTLLTGWQHA